jgi:hypothetical protein
MLIKGNNNPQRSQYGNALIYVLVAIALFASLSFVLSRNTDTSETGVVEEEQNEMYAAQLISYSAQVKSAVGKMLFSGAFPEELTFFTPGDADFDSSATYRHIYKIYHPEGGGLSEKSLPEKIQGGAGSEPNPDPGWYLGRFNNIEWTKSSADDVILVAYKIKKPVCEAINEKITGSENIPVLSGEARGFFVHDSDTTPSHTQSNSEGHTGANSSLLAGNCAECEGMPSLCVANSTEDVYAFYSVIAER